MYKKDLALNNLQWLICHKTKPNESSVQARCNTRSVFKQSLTHLNTDFSFSKTGYHTKVKKPILPSCLVIRWENSWVHTFHKGISGMWNVNNLVQVLNLGHYYNDYSTMSISTDVVLYIYIYIYTQTHMHSSRNTSQRCTWL